MKPAIRASKKSSRAKRIHSAVFMAQLHDVKGRLGLERIRVKEEMEEEEREANLNHD